MKDSRGSVLRRINPTCLRQFEASVSLGMLESDWSCPDLQVSFKINSDYQTHPKSSSPNSIPLAGLEIQNWNSSQLQQSRLSLMQTQLANQDYACKHAPMPESNQILKFLKEFRIPARIGKNQGKMGIKPKDGLRPD